MPQRNATRSRPNARATRLLRGKTAASFTKVFQLQRRDVVIGTFSTMEKAKQYLEAHPVRPASSLKIVVTELDAPENAAVLDCE
jgi:hypothetical protein